jgi:hypothetical protein
MPLNVSDLQKFQAAQEALLEAARKLDDLYEHCLARADEDSENKDGPWHLRSREAKRIKSVMHGQKKELEQSFS